MSRAARQEVFAALGRRFVEKIVQNESKLGRAHRGLSMVIL